MENPTKIEIEGLKTIHKLCKFGADHNMEGCSFTEIVERMFDKLQQAQKVAVPETPKRQGGYYIRDLRRQSGNSMRFWYQDGYGTKHKNFFWCATLEEAKKYQSGCDWFEIWHAPYIDSLIEHTVDFQLADRSVGFVDLKAQGQTDISKFDGYVPMQSRKEQVG